MLTRATTVPLRQDHANDAQELRDPRASAWVRAVGRALAALALLAGSMTPVHHACAGAQPQATGAPPAPRLAVPYNGAYTGAYIEFGETEDKVTLERLEWFEKTVGKHQALIAFSSYWGQGGFPLHSLRIVDAYGAVPVLFWSPWEPPYSPSSSGKFSLDRILAGENDAYIDEWARQAAAWGKPMLVAWGIEMNGTWFPWSGPLNGGDTPIPGTDPVQLQGPEIYKRAYRYVVDRVRAQGARNVEWVFHANHSSEPQAAWNQITSYYPGGDYVDWVGISAYGKQFPWQGWYSFEQAYAQAYDETVRMAPDKPFILAEWGVGEYADGSKGAFIREAFERLGKKSPQLKAAVFWHERWQNDDLTYSNLHVHSSLESLKAYREGVANPFWLDRPVVENSPKAK